MRRNEVKFLYVQGVLASASVQENGRGMSYEPYNTSTSVVRRCTILVLYNSHVVILSYVSPTIQLATRARPYLACCFVKSFNNI